MKNKHRMPVSSGRTKSAARPAAAVLLCLLLTLSLAGCGPFSKDNPDPVRFSGIPGFSRIESFFESVNQKFRSLFGDNDWTVYGQNTEQGDGGYTNGARGSQTAKDLAPQGSAKFLRGNVVLVSIYLIDGGKDYSREELAYTRKTLDMAAEWLEEQAGGHNQSLNIIRNLPELTFRFCEDGLLKEAQKDISYTYADDIGAYLCHFDLSELQEKYNAESIGFVIFLPGEGTSFAYPYTETGDSRLDAVSYYEFSSIFLYDESSPNEYENPATYAHELLHLFGACDLYEENPTDHISVELSDFIADNYPQEIMYYTYEEDDTSNFNEITKELSPVTLYFLDWDDGSALLEQFPEIRRKNPCAFE